MESLSKLGIDLGSVLFYIVNFGIIFYLVKKYLTKPAINILDKRNQEIKDNIKSSQKLKKQLVVEQKKMEEFKLHTQQTLSKELAEARRLIEKKEKDRLEEIQKLKEEILSSARKQAEEQRRDIIQNVKGDLVNITRKAFIEITNSKISEKEVLESVTKVINESNKID